MTANPYTAPSTLSEIAPAPPPKSIARRLSIILAVAGFVGFWGTLAGCVVSAASADRIDDAVGMLMGAAMLLASGAHIVGVTIAFAAVPEGRRLLPVVLNLVSLALIVALVIFGMANP